MLYCHGTENLPVPIKALKSLGLTDWLKLPVTGPVPSKGRSICALRLDVWLTELSRHLLLMSPLSRQNTDADPARFVADTEPVNTTASSIPKDASNFSNDRGLDASRSVIVLEAVTWGLLLLREILLVTEKPAASWFEVTSVVACAVCAPDTIATQRPANEVRTPRRIDCAGL